MIAGDCDDPCIRRCGCHVDLRVLGQGDRACVDAQEIDWCPCDGIDEIHLGRAHAKCEALAVGGIVAEVDQAPATAGDVELGCGEASTSSE